MRSFLPCKNDRTGGKPMRPNAEKRSRLEEAILVHGPRPPDSRTPSAPGDGFVVGVSEYPFLGEGWHERETGYPSDLPYRATQKEAAFRLRLRPGLRALKVLISAPVPLLGGPFRGRVLLEGQLLGEIDVAHENWVIRRFALPGIRTERAATLRIVNETCFIPAERIESSQDFRPMGCFVAAVLLE
ncbi:MAG TPA: hypothetical protein VM492_16955 [Sumerlaeia bacterium]|nr:hypothetical protein [Sumerlaeia bacterium]